MHTQIFTITGTNADAESLSQAADIIAQGGLVAFPTETVYGLGANGLNAQAVQNIFTAKGRPLDNPVILHIADYNQLYTLVRSISATAERLITEYWPGPLTLLFPKSSLVPDVVTAGLDSVAIRMPNHPIATEFITLAGCPVAAPSANRSGKPSPTQAAHVVDDLFGSIDAIIDGGEVAIGIESTVLDVTQSTPQLLRPGAVTKEQLEALIGTVTEVRHSNVPRAPGMKYKHYAPTAQVVVVDSQHALHAALAMHASATVRVLSYPNAELMAHQLFRDFRECDAQGVQVIIVEAVPEDHLGAAVMNRLLKASRKE